MCAVALCGARHACEVSLQAKGVADAGSAAFRVSGLELGGLFGSLLAGRISDALIARDPKGGNCGKRVQVLPPAPLSQAQHVTCVYEDALPSFLHWSCFCRRLVW